MLNHPYNLNCLYVLAVLEDDPTQVFCFQSYRDRYEREGKLMLTLRHPHIIQLLAASNGSGIEPPLLIFEFMVRPQCSQSKFYFNARNNAAHQPVLIKMG